MGFEFSPNEWLLVGLAALFGLLIGLAMAAGGGRKHKARYRDEARKSAELERENEKLRRELRDVQGIPAAGRAHDADRHGQHGVA